MRTIKGKHRRQSKGSTKGSFEEGKNSHKDESKIRAGSKHSLQNPLETQSKKKKNKRHSLKEKRKSQDGVSDQMVELVQESEKKLDSQLDAVDESIANSKPKQEKVITIADELPVVFAPDYGISNSKFILENDSVDSIDFESMYAEMNPPQTELMRQALTGSSLHVDIVPTNISLF